MSLQAEVQLGVSAVGWAIEGVVAGGGKLLVGTGMLRVLVRNVDGITSVEVSEVAGRLVVGMVVLV